MVHRPRELVSRKIDVQKMSTLCLRRMGCVGQDKTNRSTQLTDGETNGCAA